MVAGGKHVSYMGLEDTACLPYGNNVMCNAWRKEFLARHPTKGVVSLNLYERILNEVCCGLKQTGADCTERNMSDYVGDAGLISMSVAMLRHYNMLGNVRPGNLTHGELFLVFSHMPDKVYDAISERYGIKTFYNQDDYQLPTTGKSISRAKLKKVGDAQLFWKEIMLLLEDETDGSIAGGYERLQSGIGIEDRLFELQSDQEALRTPYLSMHLLHDALPPGYYTLIAERTPMVMIMDQIDEGELKRHFG